MGSSAGVDKGANNWKGWAHIKIDIEAEILPQFWNQRLLCYIFIVITTRVWLSFPVRT